MAKNIHIGHNILRMQLWDTAGQERFRSLIPSYLKDALIAFIVFDLTSTNWIIEIRSRSIVLISGSICVIITKSKRQSLFYWEIKLIWRRRDRLILKRLRQKWKRLICTILKWVRKLDKTLKKPSITQEMNILVFIWIHLI